MLPYVSTTAQDKRIDANGEVYAKHIKKRFAKQQARQYMVADFDGCTFIIGYFFYCAAYSKAAKYRFLGHALGAVFVAASGSGYYYTSCIICPAYSFGSKR